MWRKVLIAALVVIGLALILSPFIKEEIIHYLTDQRVGQPVTAEQLRSNNTKEASFDFEAIQPPTFLETIKASASQDPEAMIGRISIDSVGIHLPILKGTTNENLLAGATTMRSDQKMGKGNYPLAGHHMRRQSLLFGPLLKIKTGDRIVITDLKKDYIYQVTSRETISEMRTEVINETTEKQITLITCDRVTRSDGRLVVRGKLTGVVDHQGE